VTKRFDPLIALILISSFLSQPVLAIGSTLDFEGVISLSTQSNSFREQALASIPRYIPVFPWLSRDGRHKLFEETPLPLKAPSLSISPALTPASGIRSVDETLALIEPTIPPSVNWVSRKKYLANLRNALENLKSSEIERILVVGAGLQDLPLALAVMGKQVVFVDENKTTTQLVSYFSSQLGEHTAKPLKIITGNIDDVQDNALKPESFDAVLLLSLIGPPVHPYPGYHGNVRQGVANSYQLIKSGGLMFLPNSPTPMGDAFVTMEDVLHGLCPNCLRDDSIEPIKTPYDVSDDRYYQNHPPPYASVVKDGLKRLDPNFTGVTNYAFRILKSERNPLFDLSVSHERRNHPTIGGSAKSHFAESRRGHATRDPYVQKNTELHSIVKEMRKAARFIKNHVKAVAVFGSARFPPEDPVYQLAYDLGRELYALGLPPRTGAGPGIMEAVLKGYLDARKADKKRMTRQNAAQGIRIQLPFEQYTNPYVETLSHYFHFVARKLGLHRRTKGTIALPGGYGTLDELFEVWQRGRPLALLEPTEGPYAYYWTQLIAKFEQSWKEHGIEDQIPPRPFITTSPRAAAEFIKTAPLSRKWETKAISFNRAIRELIRSFVVMDLWPASVTFVGRPKAGSVEWETAGQLMNNLLLEGKTVRLTNRGPLILAALKYVQDPEFLKRIQLVLFIPPGEELREEERQFQNRVITHDPSAHQVLVTKRSRALIVSPGGVGTLNRLFDNLQLMQTDKINKYPILLNGTPFWSRIMNHIFHIMLLETRPLFEGGHPKIDKSTGKQAWLSMISRGDNEVFKFFDGVDQALLILRALALNGGHRVSPATAHAPAGSPSVPGGLQASA
jgi:predicted Rossmann-fold nucleotide-binding protein